MGACNRYTFEVVWLSLHEESDHRWLRPIIDNFRTRLCGLAVLSVEVR